MGILLAEAYRAVRQKPLTGRHKPDVVIEKVLADSTCFHVRFYADLEESDPQSARSIMALALHRALLRHKVPNPVSQVELVPVRGIFDSVLAEVRDVLGKVSIFENILDASQLDALVSACEVRTLAADTAFIRQGDTGTSMFVILEGAAHISISMADGEVREVAVLAAGDIVGEMSLMTGTPRAATVISLTAMRVLEVTKESIESLLAEEPGLLERFSHVLAIRQSGLSEIASTTNQKQALQRDILAQMRRFFSRAFG